MKMKKLFTCFAMLLCTGYAMAQGTAEDQLIIEDVVVPKGGTADLTVKFNFPSEKDKSGVTFMFEFPKKDETDWPVSIATGSDGFAVFLSGNSLRDLSPLQDTGFEMDPNLFMWWTMGSGVLHGTSGTLCTITLQAADDAEVGETYQATCKSTTITLVWTDESSGEKKTEEVSLDDVNFNVTIGAPETRTVLKETSTTVPDAATKADVHVYRSITANKWSTICLPFSMTEEQVLEAFGNDVKLAEFTGAEFVEDGGAIVEIIMNFEEVSEITLHRPCIIKVSKEITDFIADGVKITKKTSPSYDGDNGGGSFRGVYKAGTVLDEGMVFISGGQFWYSDGNTVSYAFRGYFELDEELADKAATSRIGLNIGGEITYINNLGVEINDGEYYDLQGRRVNNPSKGLYIKNGKKVFVK